MTAGELRTVRWLRLTVAVSALCWLSAIVWGRGLNYDEIEFFRASDWIRRGLVPYRDFWEHHTALSWYLFAPFTRFSANPLIVVRFLQALLWIPTLFLLHRWNRDNGVSAWASWTSLSLLASSHTFALKAIEYRVDTVACFFFVVALYASSRRAPVIAGASLALSVLANVRCLPVAGVAFVLFLVAQRTWKLFLGAAAPVALYILYLFATHSASAAWNEIIVQNALGDRFEVQSIAQRAAVFARIVGAFKPADVDLAALVLYVCGVIGIFTHALECEEDPDDGAYV